MSAASRSDGEYTVPTYRAPGKAPWFHFLHGNVPGHQIDFIYRPDVPQEPLTQQHFSHLAQLIKYIEPRPSSSYAFAIGNLSRDDVQHEPGHGAIALILGLRVKGATDHAGRRDPPFAHGVVAVDREITPETLLTSAVLFYRRLFGNPGDEGSGALWSMYSRFLEGSRSSRLDTLRSYVASFNDLPKHEPSTLSLKWTSRGAPQPRSVVVVHPDDAPFEVIARCAARVAAVLFQSDLRWTSITTGREGAIANGVSVRLVPRRESGAYGAESLVLPIEQVPEDAASIATRLFALTSVEAERIAGSTPGWPEAANAQARKLPETPQPAVLSASAGSEGAAGRLLDRAPWSRRRGSADTSYPAKVPGLSRRKLWLGLGLGAALLVSAMFGVMLGPGGNAAESMVANGEHAPRAQSTANSLKGAPSGEAQVGVEVQPDTLTPPADEEERKLAADAEAAGRAVDHDSSASGSTDSSSVGKRGGLDTKRGKHAARGAGWKPATKPVDPPSTRGRKAAPIGGTDPRF